MSAIATTEDYSEPPLEGPYGPPVKFKLPRPSVNAPMPPMRNQAVVLPYNEDMGAYWYAGDPEKAQALAGTFSQDRTSLQDGYIEGANNLQSTFKPNAAPVTMESPLQERIKCYETEAKRRKEVETNFIREQDFLRTSLRTSQRLQALRKTEKLKPPSPPSISSGSDLVESAEIAISIDGSPELRDREGSSRQGFDSGFIPGPWEPNSAFDCAQKLRETLPSDHTELAHILASPNFQAVLLCHDEVVQCLPSVSSLGDTSGLKETVLDGAKDSGSVRLVRLIKEPDIPLGATIKNENGSIFVGRVIRGGIVERSGVLKENDEILDINGTDVRGMPVAQICDILSQIHGEVEFIVIPSPIEDTPDREMPTVKHMRALFDYAPQDDPYLPCKELGQPFSRGDILHVISTTDDCWWQAFRDGDNNPLARLIPSFSFQTRREQYLRDLRDSEKDAIHRSNSFLCAGKAKPRGRLRRTCSSQYVQGPDSLDKILVYEEVVLHVFRTGYKRPVVLVGPPNVGCLELRARLMQLNRDQFAGVVPHTSRPRRPGEKDGVHYWFVSRPHFQQDVKLNKFVEWGEYQKHHYGTSVDAIQNVVDKGQTCVLTLRAQSLELLRKSGLMPYVIYIYPPTIEKLRGLRRQLGQEPVKDEELKKAIFEAKETDRNWGHYFDKVIINYDLERTFSELLYVIHRLDTEPQWIPTDWLRNQML